MSKLKWPVTLSTVGAGFTCPNTQSELSSGEQISPLRAKAQHCPGFDTTPCFPHYWSRLSLLNLHAFVYPVQDTFIQVVDFESLLDQELCCIAASSSAFAIYGYRLVFLQQFINGCGKVLVHNIDVQAARNMSLYLFCNYSVTLFYSIQKCAEIVKWIYVERITWEERCETGKYE